MAPVIILKAHPDTPSNIIEAMEALDGFPDSRCPEYMPSSVKSEKGLFDKGFEGPMKLMVGLQKNDDPITFYVEIQGVVLSPGKQVSALLGTLGVLHSLGLDEGIVFAFVPKAGRGIAVYTDDGGFVAEKLDVAVSATVTEVVQ